ncbi:primosomal protein N' [Arthrobacter echini]|uniref:Probable replication restart protein PriA n=1 Tax=Arthrobacter echini TaxID=1529066 RepID=A0A4S5E6A9_9MICC|nr:primosomal protein N' [Arthrobacter echini]THJ67074.1 primosomal protein N' [Arthrobacter echini]
MTHTTGHADGDGQLSLLHGFGPAKLPSAEPERAASLPIARIVLEAQLPHLDRLFDYTVPAAMDAEAQPGVRVRVRFAGREQTGFLAERVAEARTTARLLPLVRVLSPLRVLTPQILDLATRVAERSVGLVSDVLRSAVPPRMARVDAEFAQPAAGPGGPSGAMPADTPGAAPSAPRSEPPGEISGVPSSDNPGAPSSLASGVALLGIGGIGEQVIPGTMPGSFGRYGAGPSYLQHLEMGESPRAVLTSLGGYGRAAWTAEITDAVAAAATSGRGSVVVVPNQRDLARVEAALVERLGATAVARLTAEDGATPRYRNFLRILLGEASVAVGTRSAAYAPVRNLGLVCLWDDGDDQHVEQRAPYQHSRDVLLLRAEQENAAMLLASFDRSTQAQRLIDSGWAHAIEADRREVRRSTPRVVHATDAYQLERDPLAGQARIPHVAWAAAQAGLKDGPVLLQVARTGFSPALACDRCRHPARCRVCAGPLAQAGRHAVLVCRWCGRPENHWSCSECGGTRIRATVTGATRTAEELGRAFPGVPVISSAGEHIVDDVKDTPAVVVATPGAEPTATNGYAAVILLDGNALLGRESLRAGEDARRRWFSAAVLARSAAEGGTVVITGDDDVAVGHLVRWDPAGAASRELAERQELGLPPAVRYAVLTGTREGILHFLEGVQLDGATRMVGPSAVPPDLRRQAQAAARAAAASTASSRGSARAGLVPPESLAGQGSHRVLLFFPYRAAAVVTRELRARRSALSARRTGEPVHIRLDALDVL